MFALWWGKRVGRGRRAMWVWCVVMKVVGGKGKGQRGLRTWCVEVELVGKRKRKGLV